MMLIMRTTTIIIMMIVVTYNDTINKDNSKDIDKRMTGRRSQ